MKRRGAVLEADVPDMNCTSTVYVFDNFVHFQVCIEVVCCDSHVVAVGSTHPTETQLFILVVFACCFEYLHV